MLVIVPSTVKLLVSKFVDIRVSIPEILLLLMVIPFTVIESAVTSVIPWRERPCDL